MFLKGKREVITLNGRKVRVIRPQGNVSPEEAIRRIDELIKKIKNDAGIKD